ncbi:MAG TPA: carboxypeptidase-like regulatory domain-containing protein, partial [Saprospiraceae bacterium]|nr:carboxypeptidase-like regulatory domain-containing protein [Saprospiraceae bacterium]
MRNYILLIGMILCSINLAQSQRTIRGVITGTDGEPVIGANILAVGTTVGTVSDYDGRYELIVPEGTTQLQVSYTGYETKSIDLGASNVMDITMTEGIILETAVVTAMGISRDKKEMGYAVETVDGSEIQQKGETDVLRAMQGKVAGVNIIGSSSQPGSATRMV